MVVKNVQVAKYVQEEFSPEQTILKPRKKLDRDSFYRGLSAAADINLNFKESLE